MARHFKSHEAGTRPSGLPMWPQETRDADWTASHSSFVIRFPRRSRTQAGHSLAAPKSDAGGSFPGVSSIDNRLLVIDAELSEIRYRLFIIEQRLSSIRSCRP